MKKQYIVIQEIFKDLPENIAEITYNLVVSPDYKSKMENRKKLVRMEKKVLPHFHKLLDIEDDMIRREIAKVIELIGHPSSIPYLIRLLEDNDSGIRWMGAEGLIRVGRESIVPLLRAILHDPTESYFLRNGAHHVFLVLFNSSESIRFKGLLRALKNDLKIGESIAVEVNRTLQAFNAGPHPED